MCFCPLQSAFSEQESFPFVPIRFSVVCFTDHILVNVTSQTLSSFGSWVRFQFIFLSPFCFYSSLSPCLPPSTSLPSR